MALYLDVPSLKAYLRIGANDALDDVLLEQIVDAVEVEQIARLRPETFAMQAFRAAPLGLTPSRDVRLSAIGHGLGPFTWVFGDGDTDKTGGGVRLVEHTYDDGTYTAELRDASGNNLISSVTFDVPLSEVVMAQGVDINVPPDVYHAALMRGARLYVRRASPEGLIPLGELGVARVPAYDRDIEVLEAPWRTVVLA